MVCVSGQYNRYYRGQVSLDGRGDGEGHCEKRRRELMQRNGRRGGIRLQPGMRLKN